MAYKVVRSFVDAVTKQEYTKGKPYPKEGTASEDRIKILASKNNSYKTQFIESVEEENDFPKHSGGGYYELSNGEKVKGKEEAAEAEKALTE